MRYTVVRNDGLKLITCFNVVLALKILVGATMADVRIKRKHTYYLEYENE